MSVSDPKTIKEWEASNLINREEKNQILRIIIYRLFLEHSLDIPRVSCSLIWEVHVPQRIVSGIPQSISLPLERGFLIYFESLLYSSKAKITELIEQPSKLGSSFPLPLFYSASQSSSSHTTTSSSLGVPSAILNHSEQVEMLPSQIILLQRFPSLSRSITKSK